MEAEQTEVYDMISPKPKEVPPIVSIAPIVPILVSIPHAGTHFPKELAANYHPHILQHPTDTDWFVDKLYDFALRLGITLIVAKLSRYVIDLNRNPENQALYSEERPQTSLVPTHSFEGKSLYIGNPPNSKEIHRRLTNYYHPYHVAISNKLREFKLTFGHALFFDAHSIKHLVPGLNPKPFHQITLSDHNGQCAHPKLVEQALQSLRSGPYAVAYNENFLGGQLVRSMGQPAKNIYGLQLEMCQNIYMDEDTTCYLPKKAAQVQKLLEQLFKDLIRCL